jgi:hypothetical protein
MTPAEVNQTVLSFCAREDSGVRFDAEGGTLFDVGAGRTLPLSAHTVERAEVRQEPSSGADFLFLRYQDGRELLLTPMGVAFAPGLQRTGPLPQLPPFVTFRDYAAFRQLAEHALHGHPEEPPGREVAQALVHCVAVLEGALQTGFEVKADLQSISGLLKELERRLPAE